VTSRNVNKLLAWILILVFVNTALTPAMAKPRPAIDQSQPNSPSESRLPRTATTTAPTTWQQALANGSLTCGFETQGRRIFLPLVLRNDHGHSWLRWMVDLVKTLYTQMPHPMPLPPDPMSIASGLDRTVPTDIYTATLFLYTGDNPVQIEVAPNAIDPQRAAVLRGQVRDRDGTPVSGALITVPDHQELGCTFSREDGSFDMVVNGGGWLTVNYEKGDYLPIQRHVQMPLRDYVWLPAGVMIPRDTQVTTIDLTEPTEFQVAQGSVVTDTDGARQATLLFPPHTQATMAFAASSARPQASLSTLSVRATEYTVGESGPEAMPGELPPQVGYTYALELGVDEAEAAGALDVQFGQPVIFYVENFLDFPVGGAVPMGYYDREEAQWVPSEDGRIVEILSVSAGLADVDSDGDGVADDAATLATLGITEAEREQLAGLYQPGQSLWRVAISHFSTWDCNWPFGPPPDATGPNQPSPDFDDKIDSGDAGECPGCVVEAQNQILRESADVVGTPLSLHYASDRVPGRKTAYQLEIPLSGDTVPASLKHILLEIEVAGRLFSYEFPAAPGQTYTFVWDGLDAYGRLLQGTQPVTVRLGYVYTGVYQEASGSGSTSGGSSFGDFSGVTITGSVARQEVALWQEWHGLIGAWDALGQGLGGWSLDVHHTYDPDGQVLYLGDGTRRSARGTVVQGIGTVAGNGELCSWLFGDCGDGGPAAEAQLDLPMGVAVGSDGSLYIADEDRVRRVGADGVITTVAGGGDPPDGVGDGGPATEAYVNGVESVAIGPDGSLYVVEWSEHRVRRVDPSGTITTVAGNGTAGYSGDGGPAPEAQLDHPEDVAIGPDGSLYIADTENHRVRRVGPDGTITTVAGNGEYAVPDCDLMYDRCGDGGPATAAQVPYPGGVAVGPDGSLYIATSYPGYLRRVGTNGIISTTVMLRYVWQGQGVDWGPNGDLYVSYYWGAGDYVYRVDQDGWLAPVAGNGESCGGTGWEIDQCGDGGPATQASFSAPEGVAVGPDGSLYVADVGNYRVRRVGPVMPGFTGGEITIPSRDGSQLYVFDGEGRHLRTVHALTGAVLYQFGYDSAGCLVQVEDGDGNVTIVERDASGNPTAIVGPYGQRTAMSLDTLGYLASVANPAGETTQFTYTQAGLLAEMTDPRNNAYQYSYDAWGRVARDTDPLGGFQAFTRTLATAGYTVTRTTALSRSTNFHVERLPDGGRRQVTTLPNGTQRTLLIGTNGGRTTTLPAGSVYDLLQGPDPRWRMQVPLVQSLTITTPGGLAFSLATTRTAELVDPTDPMSLAMLTHTMRINGRTYTGLYDAASRTFTTTTPTGRESASTLDSQGRVTQIQIAGLYPTHYGYDAHGRLSSVTQGNGAEARTLGLTYNSGGYLGTITDPLGRTAGFAYDAAGRVISQTFPDGRNISYTYDANGNLTGLTPPGKPSHTFSYTAVDLLETYTPPDVGAGDNSTQYSYNLDRQLTRITRPDGQTLDLDYDGAGWLITQTLPPGQLSYTYHPTTGQLAAIAAPGGITLAYHYDGELLTDKTWTGAVTGSVGYAYDDNLRVIAQVLNDSYTIAYQYDADGLLTQVGDLTLTRDARNGLLTGGTLGNVTDAWTYTGFAEPADYSAAYGVTDLYAVQYSYDPLGRITVMTETVGGVTTVYSYTYDLAGRLVEVEQNGITSASYTYDSNGNRLTGPGGPGVYDDQDRLLQYGATTYTYSANGELESKTSGGQTTTYHYDVLGNLTSVTLPDGAQIDYLIDGQNRRVGKRVDGTLVQGFLYQDGLNPIAELDGSSTVVSTFIYGSRNNVPDYMVKGGTTYRIIADHLGSPRLVVNVSTGAIAQRLDYDVFGNLVLDTNPGFQPFGFAGGIYDISTGLVRFGARDYDAEIGRWTAKDPALFDGGSANLYVYASNNPLNRIDLDGLKYGPSDYNKSFNGPLDAFDQISPGTLKRFNEDPETGIYEESGKTKEGIDIYRICKVSGQCPVEEIWDPETEFSGSAYEDVEGPRTILDELNDALDNRIIISFGEPVIGNRIIISFGEPVIGFDFEGQDSGLPEFIICPDGSIVY